MNDPRANSGGGDRTLRQEGNAPRAWVGESVSAPPPLPEEPGTTSFPLTGKIGVVSGLILALGVIGFAVLPTGSGDGGPTDGSTAADAPANLPLDEDVTSDATAANGTDTSMGDDAASDENSTDQGGIERVPVDGAGSTGDETVIEEPVVDPNSPPAPAGAEGNYSVLANGKIYLRGIVPSPEIRAGIVVAVSQVMGEGNVVAEYEIDPSEPFEMGRDTPVYVADTVLFAKNSARIAPDFLPLIGLGVTLMRIQPNVTIEILGHTDSVGTDAANLELSQARVDAVKDVFLSQGIDGSRLVATGLGESKPVATNETEAGRQANRRVEFIIKGFEF